MAKARKPSKANAQRSQRTGSTPVAASSREKSASAKSKPLKAERKMPVGVPFKKGEDPRRGKGPPKGSGGRPPEVTWKRLMEKYATSKVMRQAIRRALKVGNDRIITFVGEQAFGKAKNRVEHSGKLTLEELLTQSLADDDEEDA